MAMAIGGNINAAPNASTTVMAAGKMKGETQARRIMPTRVDSGSWIMDLIETPLPKQVRKDLHTDEHEAQRLEMMGHYRYAPPTQ